jgi:hypothetical protein
LAGWLVLLGLLLGWLVDWLASFVVGFVGLLVGWLVCWLVGWLVRWLVGYCLLLLLPFANCWCLLSLFVIQCCLSVLVVRPGLVIHVVEAEAMLVHCFPLHVVVRKMVGASILDKSRTTGLSAILLQ